MLTVVIAVLVASVWAIEILGYPGQADQGPQGDSVGSVTTDNGARGGCDSIAEIVDPRSVKPETDSGGHSVWPAEPDEAVLMQPVPETVTEILDEWAQSEYLSEYQHLQAYRFVAIDTVGLLAAVVESLEADADGSFSGSSPEVVASTVSLNFFPFDERELVINRANVGRYDILNASGDSVVGFAGRAKSNLEIWPDGQVRISAYIGGYHYRVGSTLEPDIYIVTKTAMACRSIGI